MFSLKGIMPVDLCREREALAIIKRLISRAFQIINDFLFLGFGDVSSYPHMSSNDFPIGCAKFSRAGRIMATATILSPQLNSSFVLYFL